MAAFCKSSSVSRQFLNAFLRSRACFSSSTVYGGKLYELRTYAIKPDAMGAFNKVMADSFYIRLNYSKLLGYWTTVLGGNVNETVHLWEYGQLGSINRVCLD